MKKSCAIYPGSFDPITFGHLDIIKRSLPLFDRVIVAVAENTSKNPLFSVQERVQMIEQTLSDCSNVQVEGFSGLLVDYALSKNASAIIRGLRAISDFEYEFQMALTNRKLQSQVETLFMMSDENYSYISSRSIREVCALGGDVSAFVPQSVEQQLKGKLCQ